jgi:biotin synthase
VLQYWHFALRWFKQAANLVKQAVRMQAQIRHNWQLSEVLALFSQPLFDLVNQAHQLHRTMFNHTQIQTSTLCSIKTGGCPEDCNYCSQSAHFKTPVKATKLMQKEAVLAQAQAAKNSGATRFCMGAAWRSPKARDMPALTQMISEVKALGLETCATLGMLDKEQAGALKQAGLDYYNHNIDTSERFYGEVISTRKFSDRIDTLENVRDAGMNVCCGGILGLGETTEDRANMLITLANLPSHPQSVPINMLVPIDGTPLAEEQKVAPFDFIRTIACARIMMPKSMVRLSAGRETMSDETQAWCFFAGANSIFYGDELLTTSNPQTVKDQKLLADLGMQIMGTKPNADIAA